MQTAGMLRGTRAIYFLALLISLIGYAHPLPLQILPSIPGYIPVYIRHGDEPLENINPALAEAFHETPSSKSIRLDTVPSPPEITVGEDDESAFIGKSKKKNIYPVQIRQVDGDKSGLAKDEKNDGKKPAQKNSDGETAKLPVYELHEDEEKQHGGGHHEHSRRKPASLLKPVVAKLAPLTAAEKENLEKLALQVVKKETSPNDLDDSNPSQTEPQAEASDRQDNLQGSALALKIGQPATDDTSVQPNLHLIKDVPQSSSQDEDSSAAGDEEAPVKEQRPANILANVQKLSPISSSDDNSKDQGTPTSSPASSPVTEKTAPPKEQPPVNIPTNIHILPTISVPEDNSQPSKDEDASAKDDEPPTKVQRPVGILANVQKLAPISSPEEKPKTSNEQTTSPTSPVTEREVLSQDKYPVNTNIHILPTIALPSGNSQNSDDEDTAATPAVDEESPVKVQHPAGILANVQKLAPIPLAGANANGDSTANEEIVETRQDDKMKDLTERNDDIST